MSASEASAKWTTVSLTAVRTPPPSSGVVKACPVTRVALRPRWAFHRATVRSTVCGFPCSSPSSSSIESAATTSDPAGMSPANWSVTARLFAAAR